MVRQSNLEQYFTAWDEGDTGYFKVAPIKLKVTSSAQDLEAAAKETAKEIEAEVSYAWDLGKSESTAWWLEWGGFALEEEIPFYAAVSLPEAEDKIKGFDPKNNDYECDTVEEFKEMLFSAYDEDLVASDLKRGFKLWLKSLDKKILEALESDLVSWTSRAR